MWAPILPSLLYWALWFRPTAPSWWATLIYTAWLIFISGYFVWRSYHVRLLANMRVLGPRIHYENAGDYPAYEDGGHSSFIQLLVRCATESPLYECQGVIVRVREWANTRWKDMPMSGPLVGVFRGASNLGVTQHPGAEFPLDFALIEFKTQMIRPWSRGATQFHFGRATEGRMLRFNIKLTYSDRSSGNYTSMKPVDACIDMTFGGDPFTPILDLVEEIHAE